MNNFIREFHQFTTGFFCLFEVAFELDSACESVKRFIKNKYILMPFILYD